MAEFSAEQLLLSFARNQYLLLSMFFRRSHFNIFVTISLWPFQMNVVRGIRIGYTFRVFFSFFRGLAGVDT